MEKSILDSITPEIIGLFLAILVPFGIAVAWVAVTRERLNSLKSDVTKLKEDVSKVSNRVEAYLIAKDLYEKMKLGEKMSCLKIDDKGTKREKLLYLLHLLSLGRLEREDAPDLKALLMEEILKSRKKNDFEHEKVLGALVKILDSYQLGQIDLIIHPELILSNVT
jgi:hypothetical protein